MKCFKIVEFHYGVLHHDDFICILKMHLGSGQFFCIRVSNDKLDELVDALSQINSGKVAIVSEGSPISKSGNNYNADILISRPDNSLYIESACKSGNDYIFECGGFVIGCKVLPDLIQALNGVVSNVIFEAEHFIQPDYDSDNGLMYWIIVLKFDDRVVLLNLDSKNKVQGMNIPNSKISAVSKKLMKKYLTHMRAISQGIDANTDFSLTYSNGYSSLYLPGADSALFVAQTLLDIKDSLQP